MAIVYLADETRMKSGATDVNASPLLLLYRWSRCQLLLPNQLIMLGDAGSREMGYRRRGGQRRIDSMTSTSPRSQLLKRLFFFLSSFDLTLLLLYALPCWIYRVPYILRLLQCQCRLCGTGRVAREHRPLAHQLARPLPSLWHFRLNLISEYSVVWRGKKKGHCNTSGPIYVYISFRLCHICVYIAEKFLFASNKVSIHRHRVMSSIHLRRHSAVSSTWLFYFDVDFNLTWWSHANQVERIGLTH